VNIDAGLGQRIKGCATEGQNALEPDDLDGSRIRVRPARPVLTAPTAPTARTALTASRATRVTPARLVRPALRGRRHGSRRGRRLDEDRLGLDVGRGSERCALELEHGLLELGEPSCQPDDIDLQGVNLGVWLIGHASRSLSASAV